MEKELVDLISKTLLFARDTALILNIYESIITSYNLREGMFTSIELNELSENIKSDISPIYKIYKKLTTPGRYIAYKMYNDN